MVDAPWPSIRANSHNTGATPLPGPDGPNLKWRFDKEGWFHSPVIVDAGGTLYLSSGTGLYAVNADGTIKWHVETANSVSPPVIAPSGSLVCTVCGGGLLFVSPDGSYKEVATPNRMCGSSSPTVDAEGNIYACIDYAAENGQVFSALFGFDPDGAMKNITSGGSSHHPAITPDGHLLVKSEARFSFGGDPTECHDDFSIYTLDGKYRGGDSASGYCASGDCWGSNRWGGNCVAMCTEDGTPIVGVGQKLKIGDKSISFKGHGNLALGTGGIIYSGMHGAFCAIGIDGETNWISNVLAAHPVVDGRGYVYVMDHKGTLHVFNNTGNILWTWSMPGSDAKYFTMMGYHGLSIGSEKILYVSYDNTIFAIG